MFFEPIMNGIISLVSFSVCLLLVYREATDLGALISYPTTLLSVLISSRSFLVEF